MATRIRLRRMVKKQPFTGCSGCFPVSSSQVGSSKDRLVNL